MNEANMLMPPNLLAGYVAATYTPGYWKLIEFALFACRTGVLPIFP